MPNTPTDPTPEAAERLADKYAPKGSHLRLAFSRERDTLAAAVERCALDPVFVQALSPFRGTP